MKRENVIVDAEICINLEKVEYMTKFELPKGGWEGENEEPDIRVFFASGVFTVREKYHPSLYDKLLDYFA